MARQTRATHGAWFRTILAGALITILACGAAGHQFASAGPPVPSAAPDSVPNWLRATSRWVTNPARVSGRFVRDLVLVRFVAGATQAQRQQAIDLVGGTVVGGVPFEGAEGVYYVQLPADSSNERVFAAIATLQGLGQVQNALPDLIDVGEFPY